jgi:hypothetical protein
MFLSNSLRFALSRGLTYSTIKAASAAIFTAHNMTGLDDVTSHSFVQAVRSCFSQASPPYSTSKLQRLLWFASLVF